MLMSLTPADMAPERQSDGELSSEKAKRMIAIANNEGSNRFEWVNRGFDGVEISGGNAHVNPNERQKAYPYNIAGHYGAEKSGQ